MIRKRIRNRLELGQKIRITGIAGLCSGLPLMALLLVVLGQPVTARNDGADGRGGEQVISQAISWQNGSFPVEQFVAYTSPFGPRGSGYHYGLDLAAPEGSYIRNWWAGKVVEVSDEGNCGTSVVIESGGWEHIYCHMKGSVQWYQGQPYMVDRAGGIQIREGQVVATGTRIGRVGMTGRTTGPHLHWGIRYNGRWIDPGKVLRLMYAGRSQPGSISSR